MITIRKILAAGLAVAGLGMGGTALAQDTGFYLGGAVGYTSYSVDNSFVLGAGATAFATDDTDIGWKVYGGYQFHRNFAVELGYVDLGKLTFNGAVGAVPFAGDVDLKAWTVALVGSMPVSQQFDLTGKIGIYNWDANGSASTAVALAGADDKGTDGLFGLGLRYNLNKNVSLTGEWEYFAGSDKVNMFSVGLRFRF
ncbi:MAG: outer membrane beta-barrel protein [Burkholderiales bacterium]|nr:outer membrane beta-barrel protein [Burkholderiales bacterium]